jgi:predicted enzyme related to lactoylglutathione lyase
MFNSGASVVDIKAAAGPEKESVAQWRNRIGIDPVKQVHLVKLAHMRYQHPDLDKFDIFMADFGMHVAQRTEDEIWYRGYGSDQYVYYARRGPERKFLGGTYEVETYEDLVKASKIDGAGPIEELKDAPGGGFMITIRDPEGMLINLMHGQTPAETGVLPEKIIINYEQEKPRARKFQRFQEGPAAVHKVSCD